MGGGGFHLRQLMHGKKALHVLCCAFTLPVVKARALLFDTFGELSTLDGAASFDKGQVVLVTVTADDGTDTSSSESAGITVLNSPPSAPTDTVAERRGLRCSTPPQGPRAARLAAHGIDPDKVQSNRPQLT